MKTFAEMNAEERAEWVSAEVKSGRISGSQKLFLKDRVAEALKQHGPLTTGELADRATSTIKSLTTWANKKPDQLAKAGIVRHVSPDDLKTRIWFLKSQVEVNEPDEPAQRPSIFDRVRPSVDSG